MVSLSSASTYPKDSSSSPTSSMTISPVLPPSNCTKSPSITHSLPSSFSNTSPGVSTPLGSTTSKGRTSRNPSASTPPPSPPLSNSSNVHNSNRNSSEREDPKDHNSKASSPNRHHNHRSRHNSPSHPVTAAAAAAAAASYTSQELAIAYSMVTSTQQQQRQSPQGPLEKLDQSQSHDEDPKEFTEEMFIAMRNRIFELEAKTVDYTPFNRSRKRSLGQSMGDYPGYNDYGYEGDYRYGHGYEGEHSHHSKRPAYHHTSHSPYYTAPKHASRPSPIDGVVVHRSAHSYPSWYTPETYMSVPHPHHQHHERHSHSIDREREQQHEHHPIPPPSHARTQPPSQSQSGQHPPAIQPRPIQPHASDNVPQPSYQGSNPLPYTQPSHKDQQPLQTTKGNSPTTAAAAVTQQGVKIQRHYQPHQQMYPAQLSSKPVSIQPHPKSEQQQQQQNQQQQMIKQQLFQRYQQHRQLQLRQQQARQLQYLRQRSAAQAASILPKASNDVLADKSEKKKSVISQECSNCMALDSLVWQSTSEPVGSSKSSGSSSSSADGGKILCSPCLQYLQIQGKPRPVPPFRVNYLKKIHSQFKKALQEARFQGWQDAQVLEIEDRISEKDFHTVFYAGIEDGVVMSDPVRSRQTSVSSTANSSPVLSSSKVPSINVGTEAVVIKIEDDDDDTSGLLSASKPSKEVRTFATEASVGELFGQRWKTEPMVGYTLVHFGGSDRTRMVPMNPTVPSLTVTFDQENKSVTFAFRVLVNGLCLLASGGGPPALHMPEMADDEESDAEEQDEIMEPIDVQQQEERRDGEMEHGNNQSVPATFKTQERERSASSGTGLDPQTKKPLASRHRNVGNAAANGQQQAAPAVPRMLRRTTKQSFMDVDLQYLMNLDPATPDPFENSSPIFDDPPSLFRPLPASIMGVGGPGTGQWMSTEAIRLQKEQEELRGQYLQFLHQLHQNNAHGFLVHMNTFASEFPQEFAQLQAYIRYQEEVTNQQRLEAQRQEEMRQYQLQLEQRRQQEQELNQFKQFQEMQSQQEQIHEMQELLQEWLLKRQQTRATSFRLNTNSKNDGLDLADVFTIALQRDPKLVERMMTTAGPGQGLNLLLTPPQQQEFAEFLEKRRIQDLMAQEKKKKDLFSAGFAGLAGGYQPFSTNPLIGSSSSSSNAAAAAAANLLSSSLWNNNSNNTSSWLTELGNQKATPSHFQYPMTNEQYLKRNSKGSMRKH
ncbi:hypothetical protein BGZ49_010929 [Haplosporangium sp. Z 27]|nr:hypothetical protein BGZ49_010929 [Haplosporangium sp. Z 27]